MGSIFIIGGNLRMMMQEFLRKILGERTNEECAPVCAWITYAGKNDFSYEAKPVNFSMNYD